MAITTRNFASIAQLATGAQIRLQPLAHLLNDALTVGRWRDLDSDACRLIAQSGGRLTDSLEREIERRHLRL